MILQFFLFCFRFENIVYLIVWFLLILFTLDWLPIDSRRFGRAVARALQQVPCEVLPSLTLNLSFQTSFSILILAARLDVE